MSDRWRPTVGAKVQRRWFPALGVGVVEKLERGCATVRWSEAEVSKKVGDTDLIGWHTPSHLTKPGRRLDCGPGRRHPDIIVFDGEVRVGGTRLGLGLLCMEGADA